MTTNRNENSSRVADTGRVVVVLGQPDNTLVATLRTAGLVPISQDGDIVIWGPPGRSGCRPCEPRQGGISREDGR
jgi:hypothetical protein